MSLGIDYELMADLQSQSLEIQAYRTAITNLKLLDVHIPGSHKTILCDVSLRHPRPIVPKELQRSVFDILHSLSHPGIIASKKLISEKFV